MTVLGRVVVVLNLLFSAAFMLIYAPVAKYRIDKRASIHAVKTEVEGDGTAENPGLKADFANLQKEYEQLSAEWANLNVKVSSVKSAMEAERSRMETLIAEQQNRLDNMRAIENSSAVNILKLREELVAREEELTRLNREVADANLIMQRVTKAEADLRQELAKTEKGIASTLVEIKQNYAKLRDIENKMIPKSSTSGKVASGN